MSTPWLSNIWIERACNVGPGSALVNDDVRRGLAECDGRQFDETSTEAWLDPTEYDGKFAWLTDAEVVAYSDGTDWIDLTDGEAVVDPNP
jgi:hypothetical protein